MLLRTLFSYYFQFHFITVSSKCLKFLRNFLKLNCDLPFTESLKFNCDTSTPSTWKLLNKLLICCSCSCWVIRGASLSINNSSSFPNATCMISKLFFNFSIIFSSGFSSLYFSNLVASWSISPFNRVTSSQFWHVKSTLFSMSLLTSISLSLNWNLSIISLPYQ